MEKYNLGECVSLEKFVKGSGKLKRKNFHINTVYFNNGGEKILIDTGYSRNFQREIKKFPNMIYGWVTVAKNIKDRVDREVDTIIITHFHADHIGGLREYPDTKIVCSKKEYEYMKSLSKFKAVKNGFLSNLLPEDFEKRAVYIEELPIENTGFEIFDRCYNYNGIKLIPLEGHTVGQFGVLVDDEFYVSDAIWCKENLELDYPSKITKMIHYDFDRYCETVGKIREFKMRYGIKILFAHGEI